MAYWLIFLKWSNFYAKHTTTDNLSGFLRIYWTAMTFCHFHVAPEQFPAWVKKCPRVVLYIPVAAEQLFIYPVCVRYLSFILSHPLVHQCIFFHHGIKKLAKSSAIQNNSINLSSVVIAIIVCISLYFSTIKLQQFSLITKFSCTYISSNSRYGSISSTIWWGSILGSSREDVFRANNKRRKDI